MPITIRANQLNYKNGNSYTGMDVIADSTTEEKVAAIEAAAEEQMDAIEAKGEETLESIPNNYSALSNSVTELKNTVSRIKHPADNVVIELVYTQGGYYQGANDLFVENASWGYTDLIPCEPNKTYYINTATTQYFCFYDSEKTFISGTGAVSATAPSNAAFIRLSVYSTRQNESILTVGSAYSSQVEKIENETADLKNAITSVENLAAGMSNLPFEKEETVSANQFTLLNSYSVDSTCYTPMSTSKYYLTIVKMYVYSDDTSTQGTARIVLTKKNTSNTEPATVVSRQDIDMSTAAKDMAYYAWNISTVSENVEVYYKLVSYSSGTASRKYHVRFDLVAMFEFTTEAEANAFILNRMKETSQTGWVSAIDLDARNRVNILSQTPYTGINCCVIGDSLSSGYYDMWCTYFSEKTGITLDNQSIGGTSIAVRDGRSDSFVERLSSITGTYDVFIVFGGMNDKDGVPIGDLTSTSTSTFYGAYKTILADLQARSNHPQVIMIAPYYNVDAILQYIEAIRTIADHYGGPLVDLAAISGVNPNTRSTYTQDWTHPNQLLCDRIRPQITRELISKIIIPEVTTPMPH